MSTFNKKRYTFKRKKKEKKDLGESSDSHEEGTENQDSSDKTHHRPPSTEEIIDPYVVEGKMPTYFHIGGLAKECLITGYKIGTWHFDCTSKANDKINFYSYGNGKPTFNQVSGGVGITEKFGIFRLTQAWQTESILATLGIYPGRFNAMLRGTYSNESSHTAKLEAHAGYDYPPLRVNVVLPVLNEQKLMGYVVVEPIKNYLLGCRAVYDTTDKGFDKHALAVGYNNGNTEVGLKLENFNILRGSLFQRLSERWAVALKGNLYNDDEKQFVIGAQYQLNDSSLFKLKVRDDGFVGLVYRTILGKSITIMYHVGVDTSAPVSGDHKVGISWSIKG